MHILGYRIPTATPVAAVLAVVIALLVARPLASALRTRPGPIGCAVALLGFYASVTLSSAGGRYGTGQCLLHPAGQLLGFDPTQDQQALNVLLLVPYGVLPVWAGDRIGALLGILGLLAPPVVEGVQRAVPSLHRACDALDVVDGYAGLVVGLLIGLVIVGMIHLGERRSGTSTSAP